MSDTVPITVWTLPACVQWQQTMREFDRRGIIYRVRHLNKSKKALDRFREMNLLQAPIIETDDRRWSGFRLEKIKSLEIYLKHERVQGRSVPLEPLVQVADEVDDD